MNNLFRQLYHLSKYTKYTKHIKYTILSNPKRNSSDGRILVRFCRSSLGFQRILQNNRMLSKISNEQISNEKISITNPWSGKNINNNIPLDSYTDMSDMSDNFLQKSLTNSNNNDNDILSNPMRNSSDGRILAGFCRSSLGKSMSSIDDIGFQRIISNYPLEDIIKNYFPE